MSYALSLDQLERWMSQVLLHPDGIEEGVHRFADQYGVGATEFKQLLPDGPQLTGSERLGIYARMIRIRFMESMDEDFVGVSALLGPTRFRELAQSYLNDCPSRAFSLNQLGSGFAEWLINCSDYVEQRELANELATIERAVLEVFSARDEASLTVDDLLALPEQRWSHTRFALNPALSLFECRYPVNDYLTSVYAGHPPKLPERASSYVCIYRADWRVSRADLTGEEFRLLSALSTGVTLGEAFECALTHESADYNGMMASISDTFEAWTRKQFFRSVKL